MRNGEYGLGIDVGDGAVSAAVCEVGRGAVALPLGDGRVTAVVADDGQVAFAPADGTVRGSRLVARVGDPVPVYAGGRPVPAADLVAAAVQRVRQLAAQREGRPDAWTVVTVPPSWAGHRCAVLARALTAAGVPRFSLVSSAVAAVSAHVAEGDLPAEPTVAVYDLGAGTLDTAVVGPTPDQTLAHLAVPPAPLPWGGRDVDDVVVAHVVDCLGRPGEDAGALRAACTRAKEALSTATTVRVDVDGTGDAPVRLTREELDEALFEPARRSAAALAATVAAAGLAPADLDAVVLTGGGVRVPLVAEVLSGELGRPLVVGDDPALAPALGAATLAAQGLAAEGTADEPLRGERPPAGPEGLASAEEPQPVVRVSRAGRHRRDRARPAGATAAAATRPAVRRGGRLGRGAVVTGLVLGLLLLGPAAAGLFDAVLAPTPAGPVAAAEDGDSGVVARGSAAVGDSSAVPRNGGTTEDAAPGTAAYSTGSPARTSLAAALATAARTGAPSASGDATAPTTDRSTAPGSTAPGSTAPGSTAPGSTATATSPSPSTAAGTPTTSAPLPQGTSAPAPRPSADPPPASEQPTGTPVDTASGTEEPRAEPTPVDPPPTDPTPDPPEQPAPVDPAPEPPADEQPSSDRTPTEQIPTETAGDPATGTADSTTGPA